MKKLKSHFWYTKRQRNGILVLLLLIVLVQVLISFVEVSEKPLVATTTEVLKFQKEMDSLKMAAVLKKRTLKIYPFNPNYLTDYKAYQLGIPVAAIDRLFNYRAKGKFVNSAKEFQKVTGVSDSLLQKIEPYFKFPSWVVSATKKRKTISKKKIKRSTSDLNKATVEDFATVVPRSLAYRIVNYRKKLQGYYYKDQLNEVWGIKSDEVQLLLNTFSILKLPVIRKININTASFKEVLATPYIEYNLCVKIFKYRDEVAELQSISELKNIEGFPLKKYKRIVLYLSAN